MNIQKAQILHLQCFDSEIIQGGFVIVLHITFVPFSRVYLEWGTGTENRKSFSGGFLLLSFPEKGFFEHSTI